MNLAENKNIDIKDQLRDPQKPVLGIRGDNQESLLMLVESNETKGTIQSEAGLKLPASENTTAGTGVAFMQRAFNQRSRAQKQKQLSYQGLHRINKQVQRPIRTLEVITNHRAAKSQHRHNKTPNLLTGQKQIGVSSAQNKLATINHDYESFSQADVDNRVINMPSGYDIRKSKSRGDNIFTTLVQTQGRDDQETRLTTELNTHYRGNHQKLQTSTDQYSFQNLQQPPTIIQTMQRPQSQNHYTASRIKPGNPAYMSKAQKDWSLANSPMGSQAGAYTIVQSGHILPDQMVSLNQTAQIGHQKRLKTAQGGGRNQLMPNHKQNFTHEQIFSTMEPISNKSSKLYQDKSKFMNKGLVYGQYSNSILSNKKKQFLDHMKMNMTSFGGMTKTDRQRDFNPDYNISIGNIHYDQHQRFKANSIQGSHDGLEGNTDSQSQAKQPKIFYPSQFEPNQVCNQDVSGTMGRELPSKMVEKNQLAIREKQENNILTRIFSKTKCYKNEVDNYSDGIIVPQSFINTLDPKTQAKLLKIQRKDPQLPYKKECLLVNICAVKTHFTVDKNTLNAHHDENSISQQMTDKKPRNKNSILVHIAHLTPTANITRASGGKIDDDSITMPTWMFQQLNIQIGDQICVTLDLMQVQKSINSQLKHGQYCIQRLIVEPLQQNYIELAMGQTADPHIKIIKNAPEKQNSVGSSIADTNNSGDKLSTKDSFEKSFGRNEDIIVERIRQSVFRFKVLKLGSVMKFYANQKVYEFQVDQINDIDFHSPEQEQMPFYTNFSDHKIKVELSVGDFQASEKSSEKAKSDTNSHSGIRGKKKKQTAKNDKNDGLDLDLIFEERGLDIYYMEKLIEQQQENREAAKKLMKKSTYHKSNTKASSIKKQPTNSISPKKNVEISMKKSSVCSGSLSSKLSVSSPTPKRIIQSSNSKSLQPTKNRKASIGETQTSIQSNKSIKPEDCPPQFLNVNLTVNKTYNTGVSIQNSQNSIIEEALNVNSRNTIPQKINENSLKDPNTEIIQIVIPVENENTHKMIERHTSSSKDAPVTSEVQVNDLKDADMEPSRKHTESMPMSKENILLDSSKKQNENLQIPNHRQSGQGEIQNTDNSRKTLVINKDKKKSQKIASNKLSHIFLENKKAVDFHTSFIKNIKSLKESGLLGETNKSLLEQNNSRSPNGKKVGQKSPRLNHLLTGQTQQAQTLNFVLQGSSEEFSSQPNIPPNISSSKQKISGTEDKFREFEYDLVNQKFIDAYKDNLGNIDPNSGDSPLIKDSVNIDQIQESRHDGRISRESRGMQSKFKHERGGIQEPFNLQKKVSQNITQEPSSAVFPRVDSNTVSPDPKDLIQMKAPSKIIVSNFYMGSGQIQGDSSAQSPPRSPVVTKLRRVPVRQDTEPISGLIIDPQSTLLQKKNQPTEQQSPVQIIKFQNQANSEAFSEAKMTSYNAENETIRMISKAKDQAAIQTRKSKEKPTSPIQSQKAKVRNVSELDNLVLNGQNLEHTENDAYQREEFGHIRYGQVSIITSEGAHEFSNIDLKEFKDFKISQENSKQTSLQEINEQERAAYFAQNMSNMLMRLAVRNNDLLKYDPSTLQTVHKARVGVLNALHNYQGGPGQELTPFLKQHMKDKDAFNRAHSKFDTSIFRATLNESKKARNPTVPEKAAMKATVDKYGIKTYPKKPNVMVEEEFDMMPDIMTAVPYHRERSLDKQNIENQEFIQKFQEFHLQMMKLREAQKRRQRESGVTMSADFNENEDPYYQEFYSILELAAQNDNGTRYLQKLEEFIQKQVQDEWLASHLQENGSYTGDMSPIFNKALDLQKQQLSNKNRKVVELQKQNAVNLQSSADYMADNFGMVGKITKNVSSFNPKHTFKNGSDHPTQYLTDSQKKLLNQLTQQQKGPVIIPQSGTLKNNDTDPVDGDMNGTQEQNALSPTSLRQALEDSVGTRLSNTPDYSIRDPDGSKTIELRQAMQSQDNDKKTNPYLASLAKKESSGVSDIRSPHNVGSNLGSKEGSKSRDKFSPGNSQNLDMTHIITASHPRGSKFEKQKSNNLHISTSGRINDANADLSTALKQETEYLKVKNLKKSPSQSPRKGDYDSNLKNTEVLNKSMPDDQLVMGTASFDMMNPQTISIQQHQQATGTSMDNHSKHDAHMSISNKGHDEKMRQSSPLPSSVGYAKKPSPTVSPLQNYDNIDVKFNVVPAGPQDKSQTNIQTERVDDATRQKVLNDIKSFRSIKDVLTPVQQKQSVREKNKANLNPQRAHHPKSHKEAGWAKVDQKKVIEIQNQNKDKLIQKSKTENGDIIQQFYPIRQKPGKNPLTGAEATDQGKLPSTYTVSQPLGAIVNQFSNIGQVGSDSISVSMIPAAPMQGASSYVERIKTNQLKNEMNIVSKTITSMNESKSNVQVEKNPIIKFDNQHDFRSKSRKKDLTLFKDQIKPDYQENTAIIKDKDDSNSNVYLHIRHKSNRKNLKSEMKNMNLNSRQEDINQKINYYEKRKKDIGNQKMREYSTLNPMSEVQDIGTLSPNFIVTSLVGSRRQSAGYRKNVQKKLTNKMISGNILSTSKSHISQCHFSPKSALSGHSNKRASRSQNRDVELIIRQYSDSRIKIQNMSNEDIQSPQMGNTHAMNSQNATSISQQNRRANSHARQATFSGDSRQIIQTNIGGSHQLTNLNRGSKAKQNINDQNNINFVDYRHIISDEQDQQLSREAIGTQNFVIGRNFSTSPDEKKELEDPGTVTGISQLKKVQIQSQNTHQGNFKQILQTSNKAQRRAVSGISRKSGISGVSAQSRGSRSRDDEKLSPTGMIFVQSSKLNFVREVGGEGNANGQSSRPGSKNSLNIPSKH